MLESASNRRLLLVEKGSGLRRDLSGALLRAGFEVEAHSDASAGDELVEDGGFALRVVDVKAAGVASWLEAGFFPGPPCTSGARELD